MSDGPKNRRRTWLWGVAAGVGLLLLLPGVWLVQLFRALPSGFPPGPRTTVLDGPLDEEGYVDYAAYFREAAFVPPAENGAKPYLETIQAELMSELTPEEWSDVLRTFDLPVRPDPAVQFLPAEAFWAEKAAEGVTRDAFDAEYETARTQPWSESDVPVAAEWLRRNEGAVARFAEVADFERYWDAHAVLDDRSRAARLRRGRIRDLFRALTARAYRSAGADDWDGAFADADRMLKIARTHPEPPTLADTLLRNGLYAIASALERRLLARTEDAGLLRRRLAILETGSPPRFYRSMCREGLRFSCLEELQEWDREVRGLVETPRLSKAHLKTASAFTRRRLLRRVDLVEIAGRVNDYFDAAETAAGAEPAAALAIIEAVPYERRSTLFGEKANVAELLSDRGAINDLIGGTVVLPLDLIWRSERRLRSGVALSRIQAAGRLYEVERGRPPASRGDLVPAYLPAWPDEPLNGGPVSDGTYEGVWVAYVPDDRWVYHPSPPPHLRVEFGGDLPEGYDANAPTGDAGGVWDLPLIEPSEDAETFED